ncbi:MAG: hypothetical protein KC550_00880, partial [Nanoarchaeota archaeon]|nr:hypothetical protein [Nanoarchaeota archaeon]
MFFNNQKDLIPEVFDSCDSFKTDEKTVCMNNVALDLAFSKKNISYCDYLDDNLLKIMDCKRDFVFENSILNENISICYLANDDEVLSKCITNYYSLF